MCAQQIVHIDTTQIAGAADLHRLFAEKLGFPAFYGANWDAWIDCMGYLDDDPACGMTTVNLGPEDVLVAHLEPPGDLKTRLPQVFESLVECAGFVNWRRVSSGEHAQLLLSFYS